MAAGEKDDWTLEEAFAANRVLEDLARGETPKKPRGEATLEEIGERFRKTLQIRALLRDPNSQFRKDYEKFVEASGKPCPLLRSLRRDDAYRTEKKSSARQPSKHRTVKPAPCVMPPSFYSLSLPL